MNFAYFSAKHFNIPFFTLLLHSSTFLNVTERKLEAENLCIEKEMKQKKKLRKIFGETSSTIERMFNNPAFDINAE